MDKKLKERRRMKDIEQIEHKVQMKTKKEHIEQTGHKEQREHIESMETKAKRAHGAYRTKRPQNPNKNERDT